jgi:hypothetical protein
MEQLLNFLGDNKIAAGIISILTIMLGPTAMAKISPLLSKIKDLVPKISKKTVQVDSELADQNAIRHLRDRAAIFGDGELIKEIKSIDSKFYDIHAKKGSLTNA